TSIPEPSRPAAVAPGAMTIALSALLLSGCFGSTDPEADDRNFREEDTFTCGAINDLSTGDPLAACAWHLHNRGQKAFSKTGGTAGADINMLATEAAGINGR